MSQCVMSRSVGRSEKRDVFKPPSPLLKMHRFHPFVTILLSFYSGSAAKSQAWKKSLIYSVISIYKKCFMG